MRLHDSQGKPAKASPIFSFMRCRVVAVLERVQGGLIGQTLSKFGIAGLYTVFVYGIGRFLRLGMTGVRARIPYEDLPNTRRLGALCQVGGCVMVMEGRWCDWQVAFMADQPHNLLLLQDIYIARAEGELALEEALYWALINVYRCV